ncbi:hypothetical protein [Polaromonas sp. YR568]|uniref:hypothetical protein n=1 Tax=Polaromonas sp. YR568 TaxID=1855301 RepID=UPI0031380816
MAYDAARETTPSYTDAQAKLTEFALSVKKLANEEALSYADLKSKLVEVTTAVLPTPGQRADSNLKCNTSHRVRSSRCKTPHPYRNRGKTDTRTQRSIK